MKHRVSGHERDIVLLQYVGWPDHGVPETPMKFLELVDRIENLRRYLPPDYPYILLHCSAGIGRSGVLLLVLIALDILRKKVRLLLINKQICLKSFPEILYEAL